MEAQKNRHQERESAMIFLYQALLTAPLNSTNTLDFDEISTSQFYRAIKYALDNQTDLIELIQDELLEWSFERLGYVEQAILLLACGEAVVEATPKGILINEAVEMAKRFSDEDSYKLINATLDRVLNI
ncbi:MAG TPA: transcription antitermination factor NusB [Erysipelothrix sp.]|nr:transcription antitermination factor NusB [Erysipelothrix sp.]